MAGSTGAVVNFEQPENILDMSVTPEVSTPAKSMLSQLVKPENIPLQSPAKDTPGFERTV